MTKQVDREVLELREDISQRGRSLARFEVRDSSSEQSWSERVLSADVPWEQRL